MNLKEHVRIKYIQISVFLSVLLAIVLNQIIVSAVKASISTPVWIEVAWI